MRELPADVEKKINSLDESAFRGFAFYAKWWTAWGFALAFLTTPIGVGEDFWTARLVSGAIGAFATFLTSIFFTLAQNFYNRSRRKWVSWLNAIVLYATVKIIVFLPAILRGAT